MRRRLVVILTFPIIVFIFLLGWILYFVGGKHKSREEKTTKKSTSEEDIEMGLIEENDTIENDQQSKNT